MRATKLERRPMPRTETFLDQELRRVLAEDGVPGLPTLRDFLNAGAPEWLAQAIVLQADATAPAYYGTHACDAEASAQHEQTWGYLLRRLAAVSEAWFGAFTNRPEDGRPQGDQVAG